MNPQFRLWFSQGHAVDALCGQGQYFTPDVTYRDHHDYILAVGELLEWASEGHHEVAGRAFEEAIRRHISEGRLENALRLLRAYSILRRERQDPLILDEGSLIGGFKEMTDEARRQLAEDKTLHKLLLLVCQDFPQLCTAIGVRT